MSAAQGKTNKMAKKGRGAGDATRPGPTTGWGAWGEEKQPPRGGGPWVWLRVGGQGEEWLNPGEKPLGGKR